MSYVSLLPGTVQHGVAIEVRNLANGATVTAPIRDGGVDPVPVLATVGDSLRITATDSVGTSYTHIERMLSRARPRVVRTYPGPNKTDVPLNSIIQVVFSEPIALPSAALGVRLYQGSVPVAGTVRVAPGTTTVIEFAPAATLSPETEYQLQVDQAVQDLDGDPVDVAVTVAFTTGSGSVSGPGTGLIVFRGYSMQIGRMTLVLATANGVVVADLGLNGWEPAWSPDGTRIVFSDTTTLDAGNDLFVVSPDGSGYERLTSGWWAHSPAWSPDGSRIAFASDRDGRRDIYIMNADGSEISRLTDNGGGEPDWSPDGTKVVFLSGSDIYLLGIDGTGITRLTVGQSASSLAWSPDGTRIAFSNRSTLKVMLADGSGLIPLTAQRPETQVEYPSWSPDGTRVAFERTWHVSAQETRSDVYVVNADGSGIAPLAPYNGYWFAKLQPSWSR